MLEKEENFYLIDVREDREWVQGYISGAEHLGKGIIERDIGNLVKNKEDLMKSAYFVSNEILDGWKGMSSKVA